MLYMGAWRYLQADLRFWRARTTFNNATEHLGYPERRSGEDILRLGQERADWLRAGGVEDSEGDLVKNPRHKEGKHFVRSPVLEGTTKTLILIFNFLCQVYYDARSREYRGLSSGF